MKKKNVGFKNIKEFINYFFYVYLNLKYRKTHKKKNVGHIERERPKIEYALNYEEMDKYNGLRETKQ